MDTYYHIFTAWELIVLLDGKEALEEGYLAAHYPVLLRRIKENFNSKQFDFDYAAHFRSEYDRQVQIIVRKYKTLVEDEKSAGLTDENFRSVEGRKFSDRAVMEEYRDRMLELLNNPPVHYSGVVRMYCDLGNKEAIEREPEKVLRKMIIEDNGLGKYAAGTAWKFIRSNLGVNIYFGRKGKGLDFINQAISLGKGEDIKIVYGNGKDKLTQVSFQIPFESFEIDLKKMNALPEEGSASSPAIQQIDDTLKKHRGEIIHIDKLVGEIGLSQEEVIARINWINRDDDYPLSIRPAGSGNMHIFVKRPVESTPAAPSSAASSDKGGIDFRALPAVVQPMPIFRGQSPSGAVPVIPLAELNNEWLQIENMLNAGIVPSSDRIKGYLQSCCLKQDFNQDVDKVLSCIAGILRLEEEQGVNTDLSLKEILMLLESDKPGNKFRIALAQVTVEAKELKSVK
jgi:hypothetical protein